MKEYRVIGVMSGSSLDGLDVCLVRFIRALTWSFEIQKSRTIEIPEELKASLRDSPTLLNTSQLALLDIEYGRWVGRCVKEFCENAPADLVAVHGHTVYHNPAEQISIQIAEGQHIASETKIPTVTNFRIEDIKKGGQGAPLVPVGEYYLFPGVSAFVNLGGIANVTVKSNTIQAWDVAPCNQVLNFLATKMGKDYDRNGEISSGGSWLPDFYNFLSSKQYFIESPPKSLGNHWVKNEVIAYLEAVKAEEIADYLYTFSYFLAEQIRNSFEGRLSAGAKIMFTGGGAKNTFLMDLIREQLQPDYSVEIPESEIVDFKEALIFGFIGLLRLLGEDNVFASVTGAKENSSAGQIFYP